MTSREILMLLLELDDTCRKERNTKCISQGRGRIGDCEGDNHIDVCPLDTLRCDRLALSQKLDGAL